MKRSARWLGTAALVVAAGLMGSACSPVRSDVWNAMRSAPIHQDPPQATRLAHISNAPREVAFPGMGGNEGWYDTLWASPWEPDRALAWYAVNHAHHYGMRNISRPGRLSLQGSIPAHDVIVTVEVLTAPPTSGRILEAKTKPAPPGTRSYILVWTIVS